MLETMSVLVDGPARIIHAWDEGAYQAFVKKSLAKHGAMATVPTKAGIVRVNDL
jgi:hypothetical protein